MKRYAKRNVCLVLILTLLMTMAVGCGSEPVSDDGEQEYGPILKKAVETGKITCALNAQDPPWQFHKMVDGQDQLFGFEIALAKHVGEELSDKLGREVTVELKDMSWDGVLAGISSGKFDFAPSVAATEERKENMDFSIPYHRSRQVIVVRKENADDSEYSLENGLKGVRVGALKGGANVLYLGIQYPQAEPFQLGKTADVLLSVINQKCDAAIFNEKYAILMCKANPELTIVDDLTFEVTAEQDPGSSLAFSKGNEDFKAMLDEMIQEITTDGTFKGFEEQALVDLEDATLLEEFSVLNTLNN